MPEQDSQDLAVRVWFRFLRLESRLQVAVAERLREIGLSVPQCDVLTTLTEAEGISQQELAKRLYVTKGNISGLLDRLESAGLVERRSIAADRRQYAIYLTAPGRQAAEKAIAVQHALIAATLGKLSSRKSRELRGPADRHARSRARLPRAQAPERRQTPAARRPRARLSGRDAGPGLAIETTSSHWRSSAGHPRRGECRRSTRRARLSVSSKRTISHWPWSFPSSSGRITGGGDFGLRLFGLMLGLHVKAVMDRLDEQVAEEPDHAAARP